MNGQTAERVETRDSTRFLIVRWSRRTYLLAEDEVDNFCDRVNAGCEPRSDLSGRFYLKDGAETATVQGEPELPMDKLCLLLKSPLRTVATGFEAPATMLLRITSQNSIGLKPGMTLCRANGRVLPILRIVSVNHLDAKAEILGADNPASHVREEFVTRGKPNQCF
ncbi:MAG: hypothetical protein HY816_10135 [Candidatus Wallbacteria bacterium]|nr:hypothetical protein [Candidatus Wallbacteria bacterium]